MKKILFCLMAVVAVGCHGPMDIRNEAASSPTAPAWVVEPGLGVRLTTVADTAARVWGGSTSNLDGYTVELVMHAADGEGASGMESPSFLGGGTITIDVRGYPCIEASSLAHEVGHALIGDGGHTDPRWHDLEFDAKMTEAVRALIPADAPERADCLMRLSDSSLI